MFEGQHVVGWELEHTLRIHGTGQFAGRTQRQVEGIGGLVVSHQDYGGSLGRANEKRQVEGACGGRQPGDEAAPTPQAEMACRLLKSWEALQFREQVTDEGKNHQQPVYQPG